MRIWTDSRLPSAGLVGALLALGKDLPRARTAPDPGPPTEVTSYPLGAPALVRLPEPKRASDDLSTSTDGFLAGGITSFPSDPSWGSDAPADTHARTNDGSGPVPGYDAADVDRWGSSLLDSGVLDASVAGRLSWDRSSAGRHVSGPDSAGADSAGADSAGDVSGDDPTSDTEGRPGGSRRARASDAGFDAVTRLAPSFSDDPLGAGTLDPSDLLPTLLEPVLGAVRAADPLGPDIVGGGGAPGTAGDQGGVRAADTTAAEADPGEVDRTAVNEARAGTSTARGGGRRARSAPLGTVSAVSGDPWLPEPKRPVDAEPSRRAASATRGRHAASDGPVGESVPTTPDAGPPAAGTPRREGRHAAGGHRGAGSEPTGSAVDSAELMKVLGQHLV